MKTNKIWSILAMLVVSVTVMFFITGYMVGESITISEDGKFSSTASSIGNGTWELNGNKMSAKNTHGDTFSATLTVKGNTMTWNGTSSQGVSLNYTWQQEASSTDKEIKPEDLIGTWEGIAPSGSSNYSMRFISKSANQYELYCYDYQLDFVRAVIPADTKIKLIVKGDLDDNRDESTHKADDFFIQPE